MKRKRNKNLEEDPRFWHRVWRSVLAGNEQSPYLQRAADLATAELPAGGIPVEDGSRFMLAFCARNYLEHDVTDVWVYLRYMIIGVVSENELLDAGIEFARENTDGELSPIQLRMWLVERALESEAAARERGEKLQPVGKPQTVYAGGGREISQVATSIVGYPDGRFSVLSLLGGRIVKDSGPVFATRDDAVRVADAIMTKVRSDAKAAGYNIHEHLKN